MARRKRLFELYRQVYDLVIQHDVTAAHHLEHTGVFDDVESVYSIGAGWGGLELDLAQRGIRIGYCEPWPEFAAELEQRFDAAGMTDLVIDRHHGPFESARTSTTYDVVLSLHSWYYFGRDVGALARAGALADPHGMVIITLLTHETPLRRELALTDASIDGDRLSAWLDELGIPHTTHEVSGVIPRQLLLDPDGELTSDAIGLISYMQSRLPEELPADYLERVRRFIDASPDGLARHQSFVTIPAAELHRTLVDAPC